MKQKIEITIELPDLTVPDHLQKPAEMKLHLENIDGLSAISVLSQTITNISLQVQQQLIAPKKPLNPIN